MKRIFIFLIICNLNYTQAQNQGISNLWQAGYQSWAGIPFGGDDINFYNGTPIVTYKYRQMNLNRTVANITDSLGNLLFYTNGVWIADSTGNAMQNGLNISPPFDDDTLGLWVWQACLILPFPNHPNQYYLFHSSIDGLATYYYCHYLRYSIIDMSLNNGLGAVTSKNNVILNSDLNQGNITACRHGNGRDWWIVCLELWTNKIYSFLLTPYGITGPFSQQIGTVRDKGIFQSVFSPDGNKFAFISGGQNPWPAVPIQLLDFDRCTGLFSNPVNIQMSDSNIINNIGKGIAFSPNGQFLYASYLIKTYQFDITQPNILSTQITVAEWDSTFSPFPPFAAVLDKMLLAPDGKIYLNTGNGTLTMHVINNPDSAGLACDLVQHAITLPAFSVSAPPNHPNYFLGAAPGNPCNNTGLTDPQTPKGGIKVLSNPNDGLFTLWFAVHDKPGWVEVYDVNGSLVFKEGVAQWSQYKQIDIRNKASGIYFVKMRWGLDEQSVKVMVER